jgi:predicted nucleic-acid-binding protein
MNAVDTNILVRFLRRDDANQAAEARAVLEYGPVWVAKTVLLETAWVLGSTYGLKEDAIYDALGQFLGLPNVIIEDEPAVTAALALGTHGVGFADAMHLSSRPPGARFITFDKALVRGAKRAGALGVSGPPLAT